MSHDIGIWIAALLTLCIYSFLYRDNPLYKFAEHLFVGVSAGYGVAITYHQGVKPDVIDTLTKGEGLTRFLVLIPTVLGLMMIARFIPRYRWLSRWPIAFYIGIYSGIAIPQVMQANVLDQLQSTFVPLLVLYDAKGQALGAGAAFWQSLGNLILVAGVLSVLAYFFFSKEHRGPLGAVSRVGIWFLMVGFGASFGYTVMARISLFIGRMQFLLHDWLGIVGG